jgi:hypothetical protein
MCLLCVGCARDIRSHTVKRTVTDHKGTVVASVPIADVIHKVPIEVDVTTTEEMDEEAQVEDTPKMDPVVKAALLAIASKAADKVVPGSDGIITAFSNAWSGDNGGLKTGTTVVGMLSTALAGLIALRKSSEAKLERTSKEDALSFAKDALKVDPKNEDAIEALKEKHRMRQIARGTQQNIKDSLK